MNLVAFIALCLALVFVFQGEPDLWDKWHSDAMGKCPVQGVTK